MVKAVIAGAAISIVALVWAFVFTQVRYEEREAVNATIQTNTQRVIAFEHYVLRTLEESKLAADFIAERYGDSLRQAPDPQAPVQQIGDAVLNAPALQEVNVYNRRGDLVASTEGTPPAPINVYDTEVFQTHLAQPSTALVVWPPSRSRFDDQWHLRLTRRVNLPDGSFGGTVSVRIRPNELTNFLKNAEISETDLVSVINLDGLTLARRDGNALSFGEDLQGTLVMRMQARAPNGTYLGPSSIDGLVRYFSHRRLPEYGIFVTSGVSAAEALGPVRERATGYYLGGALISLATLIAAWLMFVLLSRKSAHEAALQAANTRLRKAQRIAKLGDWSYDLEREEFIWSDDLCAMYEYPGANNRISRMDYAKLVGQQGFAAFHEALQQSRLLGAEQEYEIAVRLPSGAVSHRQILAVPDFDEAGQIVGLHGTDQDISSRKMLEALRQQVSLLSKLDALKAIAATIAHELNQPLTAASNYLSGSMDILAERNDPANDVLIDVLTDVRQQIYHAGEIIRRVRNQIGSGQSQVQPMSLGDVIGGAITQFVVANPGVKMTVQMEQDVEHATVLADPIQIQQILVNLIRNAQEASSNASTIRLRTRRGKDGFIDVCVADDGPGFPDDQRDIFASFNTSKPGGLGIGLAISRTLIETMGGEIWVEETGPSGTIICFSIPQEDWRPQAADTPPGQPQPAI